MTTPDALPIDRRIIAAGIPRSKSWPWYYESIGDKLTPTAKDLLEVYSGIRAEDVESHVYRIVSVSKIVLSFRECITKSASSIFALTTASPLLCRKFQDTICWKLTQIYIDSSILMLTSSSEIWLGRFSPGHALANSGSSPLVSQLIHPTPF